MVKGFHGFSRFVVASLAFSGITRGASALDPSTIVGCDVACQQAYKFGFAIDSSTWVDPEVAIGHHFYSTPPSFSNATRLGDLLRWENINGTDLNTKWTIPAGMSLSRYMYVSEDVNGNPIPATGVVLLPYASPFGSKFHTLVWAHGSAGYSRRCAPSNSKTLFYQWEGPFALASRGYAVIAPDYAGQGSDIPTGFTYRSGYLHAADVAWGVVAARKAMGDLLSAEWAIIGHSEGGFTAWRTNERLGKVEEARRFQAAGRFLGSVAVSAALQHSPLDGILGVYLYQELNKLWPGNFPLSYLTDLVRARLPLFDSACLSTGLAVFGNLTPQQVFTNVSFINDPLYAFWQDNFGGRGRSHTLAAPMLVIQGLGDVVTNPEVTETDFNATCRLPGSRAQMKLYPGLNHDPTMQASQPEYFSWLSDRFANVEVRPGCSVDTVQPATSRFNLKQVLWASIATYV